MARYPCLMLIASLALGSCAIPGSSLRPGVDQEADVVRALGPPSLALAAPEGGRQLAYATGPLGIQTLMVSLSGEGKVVRVQQVLTDDQFLRIVPNHSTQEDVLRLIGPPGRKVDFDNLQQVAWDYRFRDTWGYLADFSVMIDRRGLVASKITVRIEPREGSGFAR